MRQRATAALVLTLLLIVGVRYAWGLHRALDLNPDDEALYIARGLRWARGAAPLERAWGPLYSLWYAALARALPAEDAYYLTLYGTTLIPPLLLSAAVWRRTRQAALALFAGGLWLVSTANHGAWRVGHFALLGAALAWWTWPRRSASPGAWLLQAAAAWMVSYVRPEFFLTAVLALGGALGATYRAGHHAGASPGATRPRTRAWLLALAGSALVLSLTHPWGTRQGRLWAAFGQHFAVRWKARTRGHFNPYHDWPQVLADTFGPEVHSWGAALRARPDIMAWFLGRNLLGWGKSVLQGLTPYPWRAAWAWWGLGWVVLAGIGWAWRRRTGQTPDRSFLTMLVLWAAPAVLASWLIYPRPHYQAIPLAAGILAATAQTAPLRMVSRRRRWQQMGLLAATLAWLLMVPPPYRHPQPRPLYATVRALRALLPNQPPVLPVRLAHHHAAVHYLADRLEPQTSPSTPAMPPVLLYPWPWPTDLPPPEAHLTAYRPFTAPDGTTWGVWRAPAQP